MSRAFDVCLVGREVTRWHAAERERGENVTARVTMYVRKEVQLGNIGFCDFRIL